MKKQLSISLRHCDAAVLLVYQPGTVVTTEGCEDSRCESWHRVPSTDPLPDSTMPRPLIVVAPALNELRW